MPADITVKNPTTGAQVLVEGTAADGIKVDVTRMPSMDIQIGSVEIKNDVDDTRAKIGSGVAANALRTVLATDVALPAGTNSIGIVDTELPAAAALADAAANPTTPTAGVANLLFNGTTWDRARGNQDVTELASASRTTTQTGADTTNYSHLGIKVVLDMTVVGTGSVTLTIQGKDTTSGKYYTLLAGAAVTTNVTNVYTVFPGSTVTANVSANDHLPRTFRILVTANNANAATYSVGYSLLV